MHRRGRGLLASLALGLADAGVRVVQGVPASALGGGEPLGPVALSYLMRGEGLGLFAMPVMMMDQGLPGTMRLRAERLLRYSQQVGAGPGGVGPGGAGLAGVGLGGVGLVGAGTSSGSGVTGEAMGGLGAWIQRGLQAGLQVGLGLGRHARAGFEDDGSSRGASAGGTAVLGGSVGGARGTGGANLSGSEPIDLVHCFGEPGLWSLGQAVSQIAKRRISGGSRRGFRRWMTGVPLLVEIYSAEQLAAARRWLSAMPAGPSRIWWLCADESLREDLVRSVRPGGGTSGGTKAGLIRQVVTVPWGLSRVSASAQQARDRASRPEVVVLAIAGLGEALIEAGAFVKACSEVKNQLATAGKRLIVVCDDQTQTRGRLKLLMRQRGMQDDLVVLPGASEQWEMLETISAVACLQPQREVTGLVMRAAGLGIPIIISQQAMVSWLIEGQSAAGVEASRSESWQGAMMRVLGTSVTGDASQLAGGPGIIASRHTLSGWTESLLKVYESAVRSMDG